MNERTLIIGFTPFLALCGCAMSGAPSFSIAGAYFPGWMLCSLLGILGAILLRVIFIVTGLDALLPLKVIVYASLGVIIGIIIWIIWFHA